MLLLESHIFIYYFDGIFPKFFFFFVQGFIGVAQGGKPRFAVPEFYNSLVETLAVLLPMCLGK